LYSGLRLLAERVKGPYFAGEKWTAVDMSLAPFVRRFYNLEKYRGLDHSQVGDKWLAYKDQLLGERAQGFWGHGG
jgi:glutathione S-transferase